MCILGESAVCEVKFIFDIVIFSGNECSEFCSRLLCSIPFETINGKHELSVLFGIFDSFMNSFALCGGLLSLIFRQRPAIPKSSGFDCTWNCGIMPVSFLVNCIGICIPSGRGISNPFVLEECAGGGPKIRFQKHVLNWILRIK